MQSNAIVIVRDSVVLEDYIIYKYIKKVNGHDHITTESRHYIFREAIITVHPYFIYCKFRSLPIKHISIYHNGCYFACSYMSTITWSKHYIKADKPKSCIEIPDDYNPYHLT